LLLGPRQLGSAQAKRHSRVERVKGRQQQYRALLFHFWRGQNSIRFVYVPEKEYCYHSSPLLLAAAAAAATAAASCVLRPAPASVLSSRQPGGGPDLLSFPRRSGMQARAGPESQADKASGSQSQSQKGRGGLGNQPILACCCFAACRSARKTHTHKETEKMRLPKSLAWMDGWTDHGLIRMGRPENAPLGPPPSGVTPLALGSDAKHPTQE